MSKEDWQSLGFVEASSHRKKIVKELDENKATPSKISKSSGIRMPHVSSTLSDLSSKDLVKCLNPEMRKGKLYALTEKGEWVVENLQ